MEVQTKADITVKHPLTGKVLYTLANANQEEINLTFERAHKAQKKVQQMSVKERIREIMKINDYMIDNREKILKRIVEESGKPKFEALSSEFFEVLDVIDYYKKAAPKILAPKKMHTPIVLMGKKSKMTHHPFGTILIIAPWNYPLYQILVPGILGFMAGNTMICKPSELTPMKGVLEDIFEGSGFMKDAIQVVYGGKETGAMCIDAKPDKIHFTGSVATGKKIMEAASKHLIPVDLELGGKDATIIFEDVNIERTVNGLLWGGLTHSGQSCTSIERIYCHEKVYDPLVKMLVDRVEKLTQAKNADDLDSCDLGCMTADFQCDILDAHVVDAVAKGAKVLTGGKRESGSLVYPPTVIVDVTHDMLVMTEESFGPILPVMKFKTEDEAIRLANDSVYGLGGSVWSKDIQRAERVADAMYTGNISINNHMINEANPALPFGGVKQSGFGRYKGDMGMLTWCYSKSILIDKQSSIIEPHWFPYTPTKSDLLTKLISTLFSKARNMIKFAIVGLKLDSIGTKEKIK